MVLRKVKTSNATALTFPGKCSLNGFTTYGVWGRCLWLCVTNEYDAREEKKKIDVKRKSNKVQNKLNW